MEENSRSSMVPSELLTSMCTNFQDSCCLDNEFNELTDISAKNLSQVQHGVKKVREAFELFRNLNSKRIQQILDMVTEEQLKELNLTADVVAEDLKHLYEEREDISLDLWNSYKLLENYGATFNCGLCEASNHTNFKNMDSGDDLKMVFDFNYCYSLFNSPELISQLDFIKHMKNINTFTQVLGILYKTSVGDNFRNSYQKVEAADQLRLSCLASVDDYSDDETCAEMCLELGSPNHFGLKQMITPLAQFSVMIIDFFGSQDLLNQDKNNTEINGKSVVTLDETIEVFADEWTVEYILPPVIDIGEGADLNAMKIDLGYEKGWNFHEVRMKNWHAIVGYVSVLKAMMIFAGFVGLMF